MFKNYEDVGTKHFNDSKAFIEHSNNMDDLYKDIEEYSPNKKRKILFSMLWLLIWLTIKTYNLLVTKLLIRGRKLNISILFITQSYFAVPKNIRLNSMHYFIMKIPNKLELQNIHLTFQTL